MPGSSSGVKKQGNALFHGRKSEGIHVKRLAVSRLQAFSKNDCFIRYYCKRDLISERGRSS